jgi:hypothetical protein
VDHCNRLNRAAYNYMCLICGNITHGYIDYFSYAQHFFDFDFKVYCLVRMNNIRRHPRRMIAKLDHISYIVNTNMNKLECEIDKNGIYVSKRKIYKSTEQI